MALKVEIVSSETIITFFSHTSEFSSSVLDQLQGQAYIPIILFYSSTIPKLDKTSNLFKQSLSQTLNHMHPLAAIM